MTGRAGQDAGIQLARVGGPSGPGVTHCVPLGRAAVPSAPAQRVCPAHRLSGSHT